MKQQIVLEQIKEQRQKLSYVLRNTRLEQCRGQLAEDGKYCAYGAIFHEMYGWDGTGYNLSGHGDGHMKVEEGIKLRNRLWEEYPELGKLRRGVVMMNDSYRLSFSQIADELEGQGL